MLPPRYIRMHIRCRDVKVDFAGEEARLKSLRPRSGDRYTIVQQDGGLAIQRE